MDVALADVIFPNFMDNTNLIQKITTIVQEQLLFK